MSTKSTKRFPKESGIYRWINLLDGKVWVGQARGRDGLQGRRQGHLKRFRAGKNSPHLQAAWDKYGGEAFRFEVLLLCPPEDCNRWENHFIEEAQSWKREFGYNLERYAAGPGMVSEETKRKIGDANRGRIHGPRPEEIRKRISESRAAIGNKPRTLEMNRKNGETHLGMQHKKFSEDVKAKLSALHKEMKERWITDGTTNQRVRGENPVIPEGWRYGRTMPSRKPHPDLP
jgi:group I intron endonuclease